MVFIMRFMPADFAPHLHRLTTNGALIHHLGVRSTRTLVETGSSTVRLDVDETLNARGVSHISHMSSKVAPSGSKNAFLLSRP